MAKSPPGAIMRRVEALMSLGWACKTRYQIDRFLEKRDPGFQPSTFFFDALLMGRLGGVIDLVERDFTLVESDIVLVANGGKYQAADRQSRMLFLHDFGGRGIHFQSPELCRKAMAEGMADSLAKYRHLGQKTAALLAGPQRLGLVYQPSSLECRTPGLLMKRYAALHELLGRKYGRDHLLVSVVEEGLGPILAEDWLVTLTVQDRLSPKNGTPDEWQGWDDSWDAALSTL